jgi:MraZ protein
MGLFVSTHINKVDRKGRVSVPSSFRATLADQAFPGIVVYPSFKQDAVAEGCGMDFLEKVAAASANQFDVFSPEQDDLNTLIYSSSHQLAWDPEGRVVLPESILAHIGVVDQVSFVGMGHTFQIWEPEAHKAFKDAALTRVRSSRPRLILGPDKP